MTQWHWDPETYLANMLAEVPAYEQLQEQTAAATEGVATGTILELGIGTGETARRVGARHPGATLVAVDSSAEMLERARAAFPGADLRLARLEDPLPDGPFDLVVSALVVHHLDADGKRDLFRRVALALHPGGRFVLADVVVPELEEDAITPIDRVMDLPDRADDQLEWLREAGLNAELLWSDKDLAVMRAMRPARPAPYPSKSSRRAGPKNPGGATRSVNGRRFRKGHRMFAPFGCWAPRPRVPDWGPAPRLRSRVLFATGAPSPGGNASLTGGA